MKKFLYIMPAVLICMLYTLLTALAGGVAGFQPIAFVYILCPVAAGVLLNGGAAFLVSPWALCCCTWEVRPTDR